MKIRMRGVSATFALGCTMVTLAAASTAQSAVILGGVNDTVTVDEGGGAPAPLTTGTGAHLPNPFVVTLPNFATFEFKSVDGLDVHVDTTNNTITIDDSSIMLPPTFLIDMTLVGLPADVTVSGVGLDIFSFNQTGSTAEFGVNVLPGSETFQFSLASAVPEPATWAMMLVGVFGLGAALRNSRRVRTPALA